jgi:hypothetical protein
MNTQLEVKDRESGQGQHDTYMNTDIDITTILWHSLTTQKSRQRQLSGLRSVA